MGRNRGVSIEFAMTAPGHLQTGPTQDGISASPLKADIGACGQHVLCGWLPRCKGKFDVLALVGCSLLSGLLTQSVGTAGPDGVREQGPILLIRL
jgi:hypothetical protein